MTFLARINGVGGGDGTVIGIGRDFSLGFEWTAYYTLEVSNSLGNVIKAEHSGNPGPPFASYSVTGASTFIPGSWQNIAAIFASTTSRTAWADGTYGTTDTTSVAAATVSETIIGTRKPVLGPFRPYNGCSRDVAILDYVPSTDQLNQFNAGYSPKILRPKPVLFWEGENTSTVLVNSVGVPFTAGGTGSFSDCADGPRIIRPTSPQVYANSFGTYTPPVEQVYGRVFGLR